MKLGTLKKIDVRTFWNREDTDFTPWLANESNIQLLNEAIGIELEVLGQEEKVGSFSADILCKDTINDHYVLIENQLEKTDHTHLGQLMTYAAGLDAVTIIWIAQRFTEEHRAALDWLNRITDSTFTFFGIEIELYQIGNSDPAPMFKLVSKPNDWAKQMKKTPKSQPITDIRKQQQEYWQNLKEYLENQNSFIKMQNPQPQHWTNIAIGRSYFHISATVNSREHSISILLNITGDDAKSNFDKLLNIAYEKSLIDINPNLDWDRLDNRKTSIISLKKNADFTQKTDWNHQFLWFKENLEKFTKYFKHIIKDL